MRRVINFFVFTLAAVLFPASMANGPDKSSKLRIQWEEGTIHASAQLGSFYPGDDSGSANIKVDAEYSGQKASLKDVTFAYHVKNHVLSVDIPYHRPSDKKLKITVGITGIKDNHGRDNDVIFTGISVLNAVTPPVVASPADDSLLDGNDTEKPATTTPTPTPSPTVSQTPENQLSNAAVNPPLAWKLWIVGNTLALTILAFVDWHLSRKLQAISSKSTSEKQVAADLSNESLRKIEQRLKEVEEKLKERTPANSSQTSPILDLLGTKEDFDHLIAIAAARSIPAPARSSAFRHPYSRATADADVTTAAVINSWLAESRRDRSDLVQRAQALGLKSHLLSFRNPNEWRPESFEYAFEANADGAWLATPIAGSNEIWLAPADVSLLGMGKAPSILQSLFDGMENASPGFRFVAIYAPCRLRPAIGKSCVYTLVNRGILQLAGDPIPAGLVMPPRIQSSNRPRSSAALQPGPDVDGKTAPVARLLAAWMKAITAEIVEQAGNLQKLWNTHEEIAQSIVPALPAMDEHAIKKLNEELAALRNNVIELGKTTNSMQSEVHTGLGNIPWQIKRAINKLREELQTPAHNRTVHSASNTQAALSEPEPAAELANDQSVKILKSVSDLPKAVLETPKADGSVTKPAPAVDASMPPGWEQVWREAAEEGSSQPDFMDIPNPGLYVVRLLNLQQALRGYQTSMGASVAHLFIRRSEGEVFELHETGMDEGRLICKRCGTDSMWQFAVCVRVNSDFHMRVLYPMGNYGKSNFSTGYELLIANPPSPSFSIDEPCFAELRCKNQQAMTFEVWQAIQCAKPLTLAEGRP